MFDYEGMERVWMVAKGLRKSREFFCFCFCFDDGKMCLNVDVKDPTERQIISYTQKGRKGLADIKFA